MIERLCNDVFKTNFQWHISLSKLELSEKFTFQLAFHNGLPSGYSGFLWGPQGNQSIQGCFPTQVQIHEEYLLL